MHKHQLFSTDDDPRDPDDIYLARAIAFWTVVAVVFWGLVYLMS